MNRKIQRTICYTRKIMKTYLPLVPCTPISSPRTVEVEFYKHPTTHFHAQTNQRMLLVSKPTKWLGYQIFIIVSIHITNN